MCASITPDRSKDIFSNRSNFFKDFFKPKSFQGLVNLTTINLFNNRLVDFNMDVLQSLPNIQAIDLRKNSLDKPRNIFEAFQKLNINIVIDDAD